MRITSPYTGNSYLPGEHYGVCDECGKAFRASGLRKRWDGALVCDRDWEIRHPQELIFPVFDNPAVKNARPESFSYVVNDDCSTTTDWTVGVGWSHDSELFRFVHSSGTGALSRAISGLTAGVVYSANVLVEEGALGSVTFSCSIGSLSGDTTITNGQANLVLTAGATTDSFVITPADSFNGYIKLLLVSVAVSNVTPGVL